MANQIADVLRLFIAKAAFLAGSKRKQLGVDKTLKQILIHNDSDDTLVDEWSGDSLQVLLDGTQTITGDKTFSDSPRINSEKVVLLKTAGTDTSLGYTAGDTKLTLKTDSASELLLLGGTTTIQSAGGNPVRIFAGAGTAQVDGTDIEMNVVSDIAANFDVNANGVVALTNQDDTNGSTINGLEILAKLTQNLVDGGASFDAISLVVKKAVAWDVANRGAAALVINTGAPGGLTEEAVVIGYINDGFGSPLDVGVNMKKKLLMDLLSTASKGLRISGAESLGGLQLSLGTVAISGNGFSGNIEYDGRVFYGSPVNSNRGVIPANMLKTLTADVGYTNDTTTTQPWFPSNSGITTINIASFMFEGMLILDCGAGSHIVQIGFGGAATLSAITYMANNVRGAVNTVSTISNQLLINTAAVTSTQAAGTEDNVIFVSGLLRVSAGGTFIPQFKFTSGAPGVGNIKAGSFFRIYPIGSNTVTEVGTWS